MFWLAIGIVLLIIDDDLIILELLSSLLSFIYNCIIKIIKWIPALFKKRKKRIKNKFSKLYNELMEKEIRVKKKDETIYIKHKYLPRLTFNQWLIFYNSAPEKWKIEAQYDIGETTYDSVCIAPYYAKSKYNTIYTFWESYEDLKQFIDWYKTEYKTGNAAIFENKRAEKLSELTKYLREDIKERTEKTKKELEALEAETIANMPDKKNELVLSVSSSNDIQHKSGQPGDIKFAADTQDYFIFNGHDWQQLYNPNNTVYTYQGESIENWKILPGANLNTHTVLMRSDGTLEHILEFSKVNPPNLQKTFITRRVIENPKTHEIISCKTD